MMLRHIGETASGDRIEVALNKVLLKREKITRDLGGRFDKRIRGCNYRNVVARLGWCCSTNSIV